LDTGARKLLDGVETLSENLNSGADSLKENNKNPSELMADFIAEPLEQNKVDLNPVPEYGTGFAPYFIPLTLWIASLMMTIVLRLRFNGELWAKANSVSAVLGRFIVTASIGLVQSIVTLGVVKLLGIHPSNWLALLLVVCVGSFMCIAIVTTLAALLARLVRRWLWYCCYCK
jgi:putative membrane protein